MRTIDVCFTPDLIHLYNIEDKIVVVVDILRATSSMVTAFAHGVEKIIPVATLEECAIWQQKGHLAAAERDGKMAEGFDLDNSPFTYMQPHLKGKTIAMTTTNGTQALTKSTKAHKVIVGSFLNKAAVLDFLIQNNKDILVFCAGWKGNFNIEDSLFAGALIEDLKGKFALANDASLASQALYNLAKSNMLEFIANCSHVQRLKRLGIEKDIEFCLTENLYNLVPILEQEALVKFNPTLKNKYLQTTNYARI